MSLFCSSLIKKQVEKQTMIRSKRFLAAAIAAVVAGTGIQAHAQLEEIIVSARKTDESLQDVPVAVSAFDASSLQRMNVVQTSDLAKFTPSVHIEPPAAGNGTSAKVTIRGQVQSDSLITLDPSVGWYLDDIYLARAYGTVASLFDAERVEVLKGPQGTLYGRNTTGGAIKIITTRAEPSAGLEGYVTGGIGNYDARKLGGAVNIPLVDNVLAVRLVALKDKADGYGDVNLYSMPIAAAGDTATAAALAANPTFLGRKEAGDRDTEMYRVNLTWQPADTVEVVFGYEHAELDMSLIQRNIRAPFDSLASAGIPASTDFYTANLQSVPRSIAETDTVNLALTWDITDSLSTKLIYGWRQIESTYFSDIDAGPGSTNNFFRPAEQEGRQKSLEWQLSGTAMQEQLEWITGLYWFEEEGQDETFSHGMATGYFFQHTYGEAENKSKSIFFNGTLHLTDRLNFTGGLRYSKDEKPLLKRNYSADPLTDILFRCNLDASTPGFNAANCSSYASDSYEFISWQAGFDYAISDGTMAYIKSAKASRSGGQNVRGTTGPASAPFDPETATDIELGLKSQLFDNRVRFNAAVFHTFYEDIQQSRLLVGPTSTFTAVVNIAEADIDGAEFELTAAITDNLTATLTGALLNWKFKDDISVLPAVPSEQYSLRLDYAMPVPIGTVNFSVNYAWRDEVGGNANGTGLALGSREAIRLFDELTVDSLGLLSGRISLDVEQLDLTVSIWGNNLTDEEYVQAPLHFPVPVANPIINAVVGEPRTFGLDITKRF
jgi:iron complex outermembrane receptor protein